MIHNNYYHILIVNLIIRYNKREIKKVLTYICKLGPFDAPRGIRTPGRRGTGNHRSIRLSYGRMIIKYTSFSFHNNSNKIHLNQ